MDDIGESSEVIEIPQRGPVSPLDRFNRLRSQRRRWKRSKKKRKLLLTLEEREKKHMETELEDFEEMDTWGFMRIGFIYIFQSVDYVINKRLYLSFFLEFVLFLFLLAPVAAILFFSDAYSAYTLEVQNYQFYLLNAGGVTFIVLFSFYYIFLLVCSDIFRRLSMHTEKLMHTTVKDEDFQKLNMPDVCCLKFPHFTDVFDRISRTRVRLPQRRSQNPAPYNLGEEEAASRPDQDPQEMEGGLPIPPQQGDPARRGRRRRRRRRDIQPPNTVLSPAPEFLDYGEVDDAIDEKLFGMVGCMRFTSLFVFTTILETCLFAVLFGIYYIICVILIVIFPSYWLLAVEVAIFLSVFLIVGPFLFSFQALKGVYLARGSIGYFKALLFVLRPRNAAIMVGFGIGYMIFQILPFIGIFAQVMSIVGMTRLLVHLRHMEDRSGKAWGEDGTRYSQLEDEDGGGGIENTFDDVDQQPQQKQRRQNSTTTDLPPPPPIPSVEDHSNLADFQAFPHHEVPFEAEESSARKRRRKRRERKADERKQKKLPPSVPSGTIDEADDDHLTNQHVHIGEPGNEMLSLEEEEEIVRRSKSVGLGDVTLEVPKKKTLFRKLEGGEEENDDDDDDDDNEKEGEGED